MRNKMKTVRFSITYLIFYPTASTHFLRHGINNFFSNLFKNAVSNLRRRWEDGFRMDLRKIGSWIGFDCLRTGAGGGLL
jgi:hypothetical protein